MMRKNMFMPYQIKDSGMPVMITDLNTYLRECNAYEDPQCAKLIYIDRIFNIKTDEDLINI